MALRLKCVLSQILSLCLKDVWPKCQTKETPNPTRVMKTSSLSCTAGFTPALGLGIPSLPTPPREQFTPPSWHQAGTDKYFPTSPMARSSWAVSGQSNGSVSVSYWQSSLRCFQLLSRAIPGCLQGARPWASTAAFYSRITQPSLQVFSSFLCIARFSLLSARIAKTPQWGWRKMPELKHEPGSCFYMLFKWPRPDKNLFHMEGKKKGAVPRSLLLIPRVPFAKRRRFSFVSHHPCQSSAWLIAFNLLRDPSGHQILLHPGSDHGHAQRAGSHWCQVVDNRCIPSLETAPPLAASLEKSNSFLRNGKLKISLPSPFSDLPRLLFIF